MADMPVVDVNTDDLGDFDKLLTGQATEAKQEPAKAETDPAEVDTSAEEQEEETPETDEDAGDETEHSEESEDTETDGEEEDILQPKKSKKPSVQDRINELTRKAREAERREADALRRLADAEAVRSAPTKDEPKPAATPAASDPAEPQVDAVKADGSLEYPLGEFDPKYIAALTRFTYDRMDRERQAQREQQAATQEQNKQQQELANSWEKKLTEVEKTYTDLRPTLATLETTFSGLDPNYANYLANTVMQMDNGVEVMYYLANHQDEARTLATSGALGATLALGKLEAKIQNALAKKAAPPARQTQAPRPAPSTRGSGGRSASADTDNLDEFTKLLYG